MMVLYCVINCVNLVNFGVIVKLCSDFFWVILDNKILCWKWWCNIFFIWLLSFVVVCCFWFNWYSGLVIIGCFCNQVEFIGKWFIIFIFVFGVCWWMVLSKLCIMVLLLWLLYVWLFKINNFINSFLYFCYLICNNFFIFVLLISWFLIFIISVLCEKIIIKIKFKILIIICSVNIFDNGK